MGSRVLETLSTPRKCKEMRRKRLAGWTNCSGRLEERYFYSQDQQSDPERSASPFF
jgi:hypothetical protein